MNSPPLLGRFIFCGAPQRPGKPYCANHCTLSYAPLFRREKVSKAELRAFAAE
jgi:hypothetical protein